MKQSDTNNRWSQLSLKEKAEIISSYVKNGYLNRRDIVNDFNNNYNKFHQSQANFIQRLNNNDTRYIQDENGTPMTHRMSYVTEDNGAVMFPEVQDNNGTLEMGDYNTAVQRGDTLHVSVPFAEYYSENYKSDYPEFFNKFDEGSFKENPNGLTENTTKISTVTGSTRPQRKTEEQIRMEANPDFVGPPRPDFDVLWATEHPEEIYILREPLKGSGYVDFHGNAVSDYEIKDRAVIGYPTIKTLPNGIFYFSPEGKNVLPIHRTIYIDGKDAKTGKKDTVYYNSNKSIWDALEKSNHLVLDKPTKIHKTLNNHHSYGGLLIYPFSKQPIPAVRYDTDDNLYGFGSWLKNIFSKKEEIQPENKEVHTFVPESDENFVGPVTPQIVKINQLISSLDNGEQEVPILKYGDDVALSISPDVLSKAFYNKTWKNLTQEQKQNLVSYDFNDVAASNYQMFQDKQYNDKDIRNALIQDVFKKWNAFIEPYEDSKVYLETDNSGKMIVWPKSIDTDISKFMSLQANDKNIIDSANTYAKKYNLDPYELLAAYNIEGNLPIEVKNGIGKVLTANEYLNTHDATELLLGSKYKEIPIKAGNRNTKYYTEAIKNLGLYRGDDIEPSFYSIYRGLNKWKDYVSNQQYDLPNMNSAERLAAIVSKYGYDRMNPKQKGAKIPTGYNYLTGEDTYTKINNSYSEMITSQAKRIKELYPNLFDDDFNGYENYDF